MRRVEVRRAWPDRIEIRLEEHVPLARWGADGVRWINAARPGDASARVAVTRSDVGRVSMAPQYIEFEGATGRLLTVHDRVGAAAETRGVLYALHLGRFGDFETRWLYFLASFMGTAMVGTGLVIIDFTGHASVTIASGGIFSPGFTGVRGMR